MTRNDIKECFREATECVKRANETLRGDREEGFNFLVSPDNLILSLTNVFIQAKQAEESERRVMPASALGA